MNKNPLEKIWRFLSVPLGVIGLASLSDSIIKWNTFVFEIIESYRFAIYPIYDFLFIWFPFYIPPVIFDYLTISIIFSVTVSVLNNTAPANIPIPTLRIQNMNIV